MDWKDLAGGAPSLNRRTPVHPNLGDAAIAELAATLLQGQLGPHARAAIHRVHDFLPDYINATGPTLAWLLGQTRRWAAEADPAPRGSTAAAAEALPGSRCLHATLGKASAGTFEGTGWRWAVAG